ncbi:hypothetical protein HYN59_06065 [Flavobacterium album]|uniref:Uncharacterized protein n=1 Tax=Flavobacterium album TaxID=2175091 RepID=A0A2S1QWV5_9FLAO|nr:hypothetical protein [Flavobacterium album]AWH84711.1 hypothetical protein HYN59_06065 [Flavobacterium album]
MAAELNIYSIYKLRNEDKYYLLRTERPGFSNASQMEEDLAEAAEEEQRNRMLEQVSPAGFDFIGELQNAPIGDALYTENGKANLEIYYMETEFGHPWIVLGNAPSEEAFLAELNDDEDLLRLKPVGKPVKIRVAYLTENDFNLNT